jgi:hypothetical protein
MSRFLSHGLKGREPLLIDPAKAQDFTVMAEKFGFTDMLAQFFGVAPVPYVQNGVGVIPIAGVIGKNLSPIEKMMGAVDVNDISMAVDLFAADPAVEKIAFNISSPGGTVTGVEELANKIRDLGKPTMAYTDSEMASAAYWLGSQADRVVSSSSDRRQRGRLHGRARHEQTLRRLWRPHGRHQVVWLPPEGRRH